MKDHKQLTEMLRDARHTLGIHVLKGFLSPPLTLMLTSHDTGCQASINLNSPGLQFFTVWQGSIWYSPCFEFNDRDKVLGLNPEFEFAHTKVREFFASVERAVEAKKAEERLKQLEQEAAGNCLYDQSVAAYRAMLA